MAQRVQKILSQWGIASRRQAEQMILAGRVRLNGAVVQLGQKVDPDSDRLEVDGKLIKSGDRPKLVYLLLNKPKGVISTCCDPRDRPTVLGLLPARLQQQGIHPVGRLDRDSTGALLLTNDGELTQKLTHPRYHLSKTYRVWVRGYRCDASLHWREGVVLDGKKTLPAQVDVLAQHKEQTLLRIVLKEGRNRQIRRVAEQLGLEVLKLHRIAIASIQLHRDRQSVLPSGQYRPLTIQEVRYLKNQISEWHMRAEKKISRR